MRRLLLAAMLVLLAGPALAATSPDEILSDPAQEERARALSKQLRCLVCQNQSIDDSDADLARDLRRIVREQITDGKTDGEIIDFLTARYGDFVLLKPPVRPGTWLLWFGPAVVLVLGGALLALHMRRRRADPAATQPLTDREREDLEAILGEDGPKPS